MKIFKYPIKAVFIFIISLVSTDVSATHMMGVDISYKCTSYGKYHFTVKVYRDCMGIPFNGPSAVLNAPGFSGIGLSLNRKAIKDVTPTCVSYVKPCSPSNTTIKTYGVEEHTYEIDIDFNVSPYKMFRDNNICNVNFGVGQCCRNGAITTGASGQDFWADAMVDICLNKMPKKLNSSPVLTNIPIVYLCCNQPYYFNNGAIDINDFDSISYELTYGFNGSGKSPIQYFSPLNYQVPMTPYCPDSIPCAANPAANPPQGFYVNPSLGDIVFTPTKCSEFGIVVLQVNEYRKDFSNNWVLIGRTRRDMQLIVRDCTPNNPPIISGKQTHVVCEGDKICFTIKGTDKQYTPAQTSADTVTLSWNHGIPNGTFKIKDSAAREKEAEFCWQTKVGDARENGYIFSVLAQDNTCSIQAISSKGFKIIVGGKNPNLGRDTTLKNCEKLVLNPGKFLKYLWNDSSTAPTKTIDKYNLKVGMNIIYVDASNSFCKAADTIKIMFEKPFGPRPFLGNDTAIASDDFLILDPGKFVSYSWNIGGTSQTLKVDKSNLSFGKNLIVVNVKDSVGCEDQDTVFITLNYPLNINDINSLNWKIYPIPAKDILTIEAPKSQSFTYQLSDINGKVLLKNDGNGETKLSMQNISQGTYILSIEVDGNVFRKKVLK